MLTNNTIVLTTEIGNFRFTMNSPGSVHVVPTAEDGIVTVNRVAYKVRGSIECDGGTVTLSPNGRNINCTGGRGWRICHCSIDRTPWTIDAKVTDSARRKIYDALLTAWKEFAATAGYTVFLLASRKHAIAASIEAVQSEQAEITARAAELVQALQSLDTQLAEIERNLAAHSQA